MFPFGGMRIYTVHVKPDVSQAGEKPIFVREGFDIFAFLFTGLWTLAHRLWIPTIGIVTFYALLGVVAKEHMLAPTSIGMIQLGFQVVVGFMANDWRRDKLKRQGYIMTDITASDSLLRAEQRYFERYVAKA